MSRPEQHREERRRLDDRAGHAELSFWLRSSTGQQTERTFTDRCGIPGVKQENKSNHPATSHHSLNAGLQAAESLHVEGPGGHQLLEVKLDAVIRPSMRVQEIKAEPADEMLASEVVATLISSQDEEPGPREDTIAADDNRAESSRRQHVCDECGKRFLRSHHLNRHRLVHSGATPFKCPDCNKSYSRRERLVIHMQTHPVKKPWVCQQCTKCFSRRSLLLVHVQIHARLGSPDSDRYSRSFSNAHVGIYQRESINIEVIDSAQTGSESDQQHQCETCGKRFLRPFHLRRHRLIHSKPFKCQHCGKVFSRQEHFKFHIRVHTGQKPYQCKFCSKGFTRPWALKSHLRVHPEAATEVIEATATAARVSKRRKQHRCQTCGMKFLRMFHLNRHRLVHSDTKPYKCQHCDKFFSRREHLKIHTRMHAELKPNESSPSELNAHTRNHSSE